jgi:hypothetical protein
MTEVARCLECGSSRRERVDGLCTVCRGVEMLAYDQALYEASQARVPRYRFMPGVFDSRDPGEGDPRSAQTTRKRALSGMTEKELVSA